MSREELIILAGGGDREDLHPSIACQWSNAELSDFYVDSLRRLA